MKDPKNRFSDRAEDYARYRPVYPKKVPGFLRDRCALTGDSVVADIGSGTGILSRSMLETGARVVAVEPNKEMREAAERFFGEALPSRFKSVAGSAEATTLPDSSVDLVTVANSLHWVDRAAARTEFERILKPDGRVAIVWNILRRSGTPFLEALGKLVSAYRTDGGASGDAQDVYAASEAFFGEDPGGRQGYEVRRFPNARSLDLGGLKGLVFSYSSMPAAGQPGSKDLLRDLEEVFHANESDGEVVAEYVASVYCGRLS